MKVTVGLDLGTSKLSIGLYINGNFLQVPFGNDGNALPAFVALGAESAVLVGESARRQGPSNPRQTYYAILRYLGQNMSLQRFQNEVRRLPFEVRTSARGAQFITTNEGKNYHFAHLLANLAAVAKRKAEQFLKSEVDKAVVAVPPMISMNRKQAIAGALKHAKLEVAEFIESPLAAGLAYAHKSGQPRVIGVVDLGAGGLKIGLLEIKSRTHVEIIGAGCSEEVSGEDFDYRIYDWIEGICKKSGGYPEQPEPSVKLRIKDAGERLKRELSFKKRADVNLPCLFFDRKQRPFNLEASLERTEFNRLTADLAATLEQTLKQTLKSCHMLPKDLEEIVFVGGLSHIPYLKQQLQNVCKEWTITSSVNHLVSFGAALKAGALHSNLYQISQRQFLKMNRLPPGHLFAGRYEAVGQIIGEGSFSFIYEVKDRRDQCTYALKILKPEFRQDETVYERFMAAAKLSLNIEDENIVRFYEIIDTEDLTAIRMELMRGWTLEEFMKSGRFERMRPAAQIDLIMGILTGMICLRANNLYHGDLKPDNIWVDVKGRIKLFDFGLARYADGSPIVPSKVTGTPRYMSPEHFFKHSPFGDWSEIYSLGLIVYRLFAGEFPHKAGNPEQEYLIFDFTESEPIDPCKVNPKLPRELGDIIFKCIRRTRSERFQRFEELREELQRYKERLS